MKILELLKRPAQVQVHSCNCCAEHCAEPPDTERSYHSFDRLLLIRLICAVALLAIAIVLRNTVLWSTILAIAAALTAGYDVIYSAAINVKNKKPFDETFLMTIAAIAAFCVGEALEGAAVLILFQIGELFQDYAVGCSRGSIASLMNLRPDTATVVVDGEEQQVSVDDVRLDDVIIIRPGERVAVDCTVIEGTSAMDMSSLTGESMPVTVSAECELLSGAMNLDGVLQTRVTALASESTAARILDLVQSEAAKKGPTEKFITKFARIYTPIVVVLAVLTAIVIPLVSDVTIIESIKKACNFLVISCPCALVISVPLAYFAGIGGASKYGVLFKNSGAMDILAKAQAVVFDKTGTLTQGKFVISDIIPEQGVEKNLLLRTAAHAEFYSTHPIAKSIVDAYGEEIQTDLLDEYREHAGMGVTAAIGGVRVAVGNSEFIKKFNIKTQGGGSTDVAIHIAIEGKYAGRILLADAVKPDAAEAIDELQNGYNIQVAMVSGDSKAINSRLAERLGITEFYAECLPADKVRHIGGIKSRIANGGSLIFVGDGINDAPVLTAADAGVAMGGLGSDAAVEAAEVVIMDDKPTKIIAAINLAKKTRIIVIQNVVAALGMKLIVLILSICLNVPLWLALFSDVGVALLAILNSMRAFGGGIAAKR